MAAEIRDSSSRATISPSPAQRAPDQNEVVRDLPSENTAAGEQVHHEKRLYTSQKTVCHNVMSETSGGRRRAKRNNDPAGQTAGTPDRRVGQSVVGVTLPPRAQRADPQLAASAALDRCTAPQQFPGLVSSSKIFRHPVTFRPLSPSHTSMILSFGHSVTDCLCVPAVFSSFVLFICVRVAPADGLPRVGNTMKRRNSRERAQTDSERTVPVRINELASAGSLGWRSSLAKRR